MRRSLIFIALTLVLAAPKTWAQVGADIAEPPPPPEATVAGELLTEPPTLLNLGFEWFIQGDSNRNASVAVAYRPRGQTDWIEAMPLLRLQGERIYAESRVDVIAPNMFAGSVLDLEPDTEYEVRFIISDPDGVHGAAERQVTVQTRAEPAAYAGGRVFHVYPHGHDGPKLEPAFEGLMCAYNFWCAGTDWATAGRPRVRAGDTILVHAGVYQYDRYEYTNDPSVNRTTPLDGTYYLTEDGTAEKPIAIKAAGDGEVIFDGNGNYALFDVRAADYTLFEGITFRNAEIGILAGTQFLAGAKGLAVKRSRFEDVGAGVFTNYSGSSGFYIADNTFIGRNDAEHMMAWRGDLWAQFEGVNDQVFPPRMLSYVAVKLYGPGMSWLTTTLRTFTMELTSKLMAHRMAQRPAAPASSMAPATRRATIGTSDPSRSTSTTTTSPTHTTIRSKPTAACTTSASCGTCLSIIHRMPFAISPHSVARSTGSATSLTTFPAARRGSRRVQPALCSTTTRSSRKLPWPAARTFIGAII